MPLTSLAADAFGVVTFCLSVLLIVVGVLCIAYLLFFSWRVRREGYVRLGYFNGPWVVRIFLILLSIIWCVGEIIRLDLLKSSWKVLQSVNTKWQETLCKVYILSNFGFAEPCLFITVILLLHASLQTKDTGTLSRKWNLRTIGYILLYCLPMLFFQLIIVLVGPMFTKTADDDVGKVAGKVNEMKVLPGYFTRTSTGIGDEDAFCTYPLLSTLIHGVFVILLVIYVAYWGSRMLSSVINRCLRTRVYCLIFSVGGLLPFRVILLGCSVLFNPEEMLFEVLEFLGFMSLLACAVVAVGVLVYFPVADSYALSGGDVETDGSGGDGVPLIMIHNHDESGGFSENDFLLCAASAYTSVGRTSEASTRGGSISFRGMLKGGVPLEPEPEEVNLFAGNLYRLSSPPGSPPLPGRPMVPLSQLQHSSI